VPKIDLTLTEGAIPQDKLAELPGQMAATLLKWEGAPDTDFFRAVSWTHVRELPADAVHTADGVAEHPHFVAEVSVPEGALSDRRRAGLVEEVTKLIADAAGLEDEQALLVWVLVREIDEGSWGAGGQIIRFEQLREAAATERKKSEAEEKAPVAS